MFKVGDRVVYLNPGFNACWLGWAHDIPKHGAIYTVRRVFFDPHYLTGAPGYGLWLEELHNPPTLREGREPSFGIEYFRKLRPDQEAGMSSARDMRPRRPAVEFTGPPLPVSGALRKVSAMQDELC